MLAKEQALNQIQKLLALGDKSRNDSDAEAELAILKAQELMAKYDISIEEANEEKGPEYLEATCEHKWDYAYRVPLAHVMAKNFRCELFLRGKRIIFMGHKTDAEICKATFEFAYNFIMKRGSQEYNWRYQAGRRTKGVFNSYATGFIIGLQKALDAQCVALAIVTPPDVTSRYEEMSKNWKVNKTRMRGDSMDPEIVQKGVKDGKEFMTKKSIKD